MSLEELLSHFAVALAIGLLIGLERGWATREDEPGSRTAGIRTFAITGLLGGTAGAMALAAGGPASAGGGIVLGLSFAAYAAVITVFAREENRADKTFSATTAIAAILTFALGAYALVGDLRVAAAAAVATAGLLALRQVLHAWVAKVTWPELRSALLLLAMTTIALPLIPADPVGPFGGVNLRETWLIAIVLAGVSFLGYAAIKILGEGRGVLIAAAAGGLVSSTAVMLTNARRAAAREGEPRLLAAGAMIATFVSITRTAFIVGILNRDMLWHVIAPLAAAGLASAVVGLVLSLRAQSGPAHDNAAGLRNPFDLRSVLTFALVLSLLVVVARVITEQFGATGAILAALVTGAADVDAVTVSMTKLAPATLGVREAALAVLAAVLSNTLVKAIMGGTIGGGQFAVVVAISTLIAIGAAAAAWIAALTFTG